MTLSVRHCASSQRGGGAPSIFSSGEGSCGAHGPACVASRTPSHGNRRCRRPEPELPDRRRGERDAPEDVDAVAHLAADLARGGRDDGFVDHLAHDFTLPWCGEGGADDAGLVQQLRRHDLGPGLQSSGRNLSLFLLTPPPMMNRSGQTSASMWASTSFRRLAHFCPSSGPCPRGPSRTRAARPPCPGSRGGRTRCWARAQPSVKSALPMPVPSVITMIVPGSTLPGAELHLGDAGGVGVVDHDERAVRDVLEQRLRVGADPGLVDVRRRLSATPRWTTAGKVHPIGPVVSKWATIWPTTRATSPGDPPGGVGMRRRSAVSVPCSRSTGAPLMPVPPMSMPRIVVICRSLPESALPRSSGPDDQPGA